MGTPRLSWLANELRTKSMAVMLAASRRRRVRAEKAEVARAITRIAATSAPRRMFGRSSRLRSGTSGWGCRSVLQAQGFDGGQAGGPQSRRDRDRQHRQKEEAD